MQRLSGLLKKFAKEPEYETDYRIAVQKYMDDGYAQQIIDRPELDHPRQWFLPHHGVYKKSADKKKLRIVFDATAEYKGKSLNNSMMTGPKFEQVNVWGWRCSICSHFHLTSDRRGQRRKAGSSKKSHSRRISTWTTTWIASTFPKKISGWEDV